MALIIGGVVLVIIILWFISAQRKLVAIDENINNAMGQIGVQLSSRWDALTALLDLTKGYADHEYKTISDTIKMRTSINSNSSAAEVNKQENMLTEAMGKIMAVAESYPELKANENYIKTMDSVNEYEKMVRQSRLIYNDSVTKLNHTIRMFPTSIAAGMLHITSRDYLEASEQKAELALNVARKEMDILNRIDYKNGYSLYIGIPFCPSICLYCSFSSYALGAYKDYVDSYLDALIKEMEFVSGAMKGRRLDTVYFGGGTPTTLSAAQLDRLITELKRLFDIDGCHEFTVEAGRPDSITLDKLKVLKKHNVGRISINPQTMNQKTLDLIGRKHTVEQIKNVYNMAREEGFDNINMDIILGLVGEDVDEVKHTLSEIQAMNPESLTVHSLAIKRAAALNIWRDKYKQLSTKNTDEIIRMTEETAKKLDMEPYYMYRQKNMAGNFENVGYSKEGKECIYNILIMEEKQTIIACGAGASSKVVFHNESDDNHSVRIERIENVKDVRNYIGRIDEMIERKREFFKDNQF